MRQILFPKAGPPESMKVVETPDPDPGPGEVRVRTVAAGINFADISARMGMYPDAPPFPCVIGYEASGTIDALGDGVDDLTLGQQVVVMTRFGGYSDTVVVPAMQAVPVPDGLDLKAAAGLPVTYLTAWLMLMHLGRVGEGDTVLVHSAGGGVGLSALQICKWRGARVIGTASSGKHARLKEMGLDHAIDYRTEDFEAEVKRITDGAGVDIVLDAVGGDSFKKSYRCLTDFGRLFLFGVSSFNPGLTRSIFAALKGLARTPRFHPFNLMNDNKGVHGVNLGHLWHRLDVMRPMFDRLVGLAAEGVLSPVIDATFDFDHAADAHHYIQARKNFGKVLLTP